MTHTTPTEAREVVDRLEAKKLDVSTWVAVTALRSLADQLEAVTAERDSYNLDAERYQWLRGHPTYMGWEHDFRADEIDCSLDADIAKEKTT